MIQNNQIRCGECQTTIEESPDMFVLSGGRAHICGRCLIEMADEVKEELSKARQTTSGALKTPSQLVAFMNEYVVGQDQAKRALAVAVYNHYKRLNNISDVELSKSNVLMLGPTGSGKTLLAQTLARVLDVPIAIADATSLTQAGYVGDDVETILTRLIQAAGGDIRKAERGIVFVDEIDKVRAAKAGPSISRDVSGEGVQQALLKIIEGAVVNVPMGAARKTPGAQLETIDTTNILFICAGAFVDLDKILSKRVSQTKKGNMGFVAELQSKREKTDALPKPTPEDLSEYGMIPEFIGRVPVVVRLNKLTVSDLEHVMTQPKNAIVRQMVELFRMDGVALSFTPSAVRHVAELAHKQGTGARGVRTILEDALQEAMFSLPDTETKELVVDDEFLVAAGIIETHKEAA